MAEVMLQLGDYPFGIDTAAYQRLRRVAEYRWPAQDRIGRDPALQYVGPGRQRIDLAGVIYPGEFGTPDQVARMRSEAGKGAPLLLVAAPEANQGVILGYWVITRIEETGTEHLPGGAPRRIDFRMELGYYGEDSPVRR